MQAFNGSMMFVLGIVLCSEKGIAQQQHLETEDLDAVPKLTNYITTNGEAAAKGRNT